MSEPSPEISHRSDFSLLCNARGLDVAVEIGTDRGVFATDFMSRWSGRELMCVDPYLPYDEMIHPRRGDQLMAVLALQRFWPRVRMYEVPSPRAVGCVMPWNRPVGFIYIDGSHVEENVLTDLAAWWPVLDPERGILAGHDYDQEHPGVVAAVDAFAATFGKNVYLTQEKQPSWYFYATEPERLIRKLFVQGDIDNPKRI